MEHENLEDNTQMDAMEHLKDLITLQDARKSEWIPRKLPILYTISILQEHTKSILSRTNSNTDSVMTNPSEKLDHSEASTDVRSETGIANNITLDSISENGTWNDQRNVQWKKDLNEESEAQEKNQQCYVNIRTPAGIISMHQSKLIHDTKYLIPNIHMLYYLYTHPKSQFLPFKKIFGHALASNTLRARKNELIQFKYYQNQLSLIKDNISLIIDNSENIRKEARLILEETKDFDEQCRHLMERIQQLEYFTNEVRDKLSYFDSMESFQQMLVDSWNLTYWKQNLKKKFFAEQLNKLDDRIRFLEQHIDYKYAESFLRRLKYIKTKALTILRDVVVISLKDVASNLTKEMQASQVNNSESLRTSQSATTNSASNFDLDIFEQQFSLLYIEFQSQVEFLKIPIELIEHRCEQPNPTTVGDDTSSISSLTSRSASYTNEYHVFLQDCFQVYHEQRKILLQPIIQQQSNALAKTGDLIQIARVGCSIIIQFTIQETKLVTKLFKSPYVKSSFKEMVQSFCYIMFESLRTVIIHEDNIETLATCVEILRREILHDAIRPKRNYLRYIESIVHQMIQDVQERLIFKSSLYIRENIQLYSPKDEDLNFPERFQQSNDISDSEVSIPYSDWYPPLQRSLSLLSKLYNRIEMSVFEGLAHEVVSLCTDSFMKASQIIAQKSSILDGELFLISHLLALRMELIPFDKLQLTNVETKFDFSHVKEGIVRFLKGQASFHMKSFIYDIMSNTQPKIVHNAIDSKKNLEKRLKTSYDGFVINVTKLCFDDLMMFMKSQQIQQKVDTSNNNMALQEMYKKSLENIHRIFSKELVQKMRLYIRQQKTRIELFEGIQDSLLGVYIQFLSQVGQKDDFLDAQALQDLLNEYRKQIE